MFLQLLQISQENTQQIYFKKEQQHRCFLLKFARVLRIPISIYWLHFQLFLQNNWFSTAGAQNEINISY